MTQKLKFVFRRAENMENGEKAGYQALCNHEIQQT